jgi:hypothetical protein
VLNVAGPASIGTAQPQYIQAEAYIPHFLLCTIQEDCPIADELLNFAVQIFIRLFGVSIRKDYQKAIQNKFSFSPSPSKRTRKTPLPHGLDIPLPSGNNPNVVIFNGREIDDRLFEAVVNLIRNGYDSVPTPTTPTSSGSTCAEIAACTGAHFDDRERVNSEMWEAHNKMASDYSALLFEQESMVDEINGYIDQLTSAAACAESLQSDVDHLTRELHDVMNALEYAHDTCDIFHKQLLACYPDGFVEDEDQIPWDYNVLDREVQRLRRQTYGFDHQDEKTALTTATVTDTVTDTSTVILPSASASPAAQPFHPPISASQPLPSAAADSAPPSYASWS